MIHLYGIPNCDTVKKARTWLIEQGLEHSFHDFKKQSPSVEQCLAWSQAVGWANLINKRGTTWRALNETSQASLMDDTSAAQLAHANPSLIKRPVVEWANGETTVGFQAETWATRTGQGQ